MERRDPSRNMARFYALALERSLFGEVTLVRRWGRIGSWERVRMEDFADERTALAAMMSLARVKSARGYRLRR